MNASQGASAATGPEWHVHLLMTLAIVFLAISVIFGRVYHAEVPPAGMAFWRAVAAFILLLPFVYRDFMVHLPLALRHWKLMLLIGVSQSVLGQIPFFLGLHSTTAINGGLITATQPALIFLLAWIFLRDPTRMTQIVGLAVALCGALVVIVRNDLAALLRLDFVTGDLLVQLGVLSWAGFFILIKRAPHELRPMVLFETTTLAAIVVLAPCYAAEILFWNSYTAFNVPTVFTVLYLAIFGSILALIFFNIGIRRLGPGRSGAYNYLIPIFTALLAVVVLDETLEVYHLIGLVLVCAGVFLTNRPHRVASKDRP